MKTSRATVFTGRIRGMGGFPEIFALYELSRPKISGRLLEKSGKSAFCSRSHDGDAEDIRN